MDASEKRLALSDGLLWALLFLSPLAVGTVHIHVWAVAAVLLFVALLLALSGTKACRSIPWIIVVTACLWGLGLAIQNLPLPLEVVTYLSGEAGRIWSLGVPTAGVEEAAGWATVHQSPGAGSFQLLRWVTAYELAALCALRGTDRMWRRRLPRVLFAAVLCASAVALLQTANNSQTVLGLYTPRSGFHDVWRSPLLNPNHWSAYLSMGALIAFGLALHSEGKRQQILSALYGLGGLLLVAQVCFSSSRGGVLGMGVGAAAFVLLVFVRETKDRSRRLQRLRLGAFLLSVTLVGVALWGAVSRTSTRLDPYSGDQIGGFAEESRLELLPVGLRVLEDHRLTGVGRDALYDVFPRYRGADGEALARWMEVLPFDLVFDFGLPLGLLLNLCCVVMLVLVLRRGKLGSVYAGVAAALVSLAVHELGDFATEGGAVLFLAVAMATFILQRSNDESPVEEQGSWWPWLVGGSLCLLLFLQTSPAWKHSDVSRCLDRMSTAQERGQSWKSLGEEAWGYHPSSFPLALGIGVGAQGEGDAMTALAWFNRAQLLAPRHPEPHLRTARLLRRLGAEDQALVEYRLAMEGDWRGRARGIFAEVARAYSSEGALRRLVPSDRPEAIAQFAMWLRELGDGRAAALGIQALSDLEDSPARLMAGVYAHIDRSEFLEAQALIEEGWATEGLAPTMRLRLAVSMGWAGMDARALTMLRELSVDVESPWPSLWYSLGKAEARSGDASAARRALRRIGHDASANWRAKSLRVEADLARSEGRIDEAERLTVRAAALESSAGSVDQP